MTSEKNIDPSLNGLCIKRSRPTKEWIKKARQEQRSEKRNTRLRILFYSVFAFASAVFYLVVEILGAPPDQGTPIVACLIFILMVALGVVFFILFLLSRKDLERASDITAVITAIIWGVLELISEFF